MLRTCSEPDMTKLYPISEAIESSNKSEPHKQQEHASSELKSTSKRLIKSLEDLDEIDSKSRDENNEVYLLFLNSINFCLKNFQL